MPASVNTVTGPLPVEQLGVTLMHEHLVIAYPGWESDTLHRGPKRRDRIAICVDRVQQMQDIGVQSMLDPCPSDLGRDVELAAEVAVRTGFNIVVATGLYKEDQGARAYWSLYQELGTASERMAELFVHEIERGVGDTGIRPGVIKVGTGAGRITDYEYDVLAAAATASLATDTPITTHTDQGTMGPEQQAFLMERGVPAHRIIIGHSCGNAEHDYHRKLADGGSYLGFDRFGLEVLAPDATRVANLLRLIEAGHERQIVVSHDCVFCTRGVPFPPELLEQLDAESFFNPTHFHRHILPQLRSAGVGEAHIDALLVDNPRRYFAGSPPGDD